MVNENKVNAVDTVEVLEKKDICAATVESEGNGKDIREVNGGKKRGRKAGETMPLLQIGSVVRRFSKKELGVYFLQAAIADYSKLGDKAVLLLNHGRPLPVVPPAIDISDWTKIDYLGAIAKLMQ